MKGEGGLWGEASNGGGWSAMGRVGAIPVAGADIITYT